MYGTCHKRPFVPSVWVSDYYVMYRQSAQSVCEFETSAAVTYWMNDPLDCSENLCEKFVVRGREF